MGPRRRALARPCRRRIEARMSRDAGAVAEEPRRYVFEGRTVTMPVVVRDASSAAAT